MIVLGMVITVRTCATYLVKTNRLSINCLCFQVWFLFI